MSINDPRERVLTEQIACAIVDYMRKQRLEPGFRLRTQVLADLLSVSRSPISAALNLLKTKGLVRHIPRRGYELVVAGEMIPELDFRIDTQDHESERIYSQFAMAHLRGKLPARFTESALRRFLNITKAQLSELLTRLVKEGLIESAPGYGWVLNDVLVSRESAEKSYQFRLIIEPAAILETSFTPNKDELMRLRIVHEAMLDGGLSDMSSDQIFNTNVDFHETIISWSNNPFLVNALKKQNSLRRFLVRDVIVDPKRHERIIEEHLVLLDALSAHQFLEASRLMTSHLSINAKRLNEAFNFDNKGYSSD